MIMDPLSRSGNSPVRLSVYSPFNVESSPVRVKAQQGLHVGFTQLKVKHLKEEERLKI